MKDKWMVVNVFLNIQTATHLSLQHKIESKNQMKWFEFNFFLPSFTPLYLAIKHFIYSDFFA